MKGGPEYLINQSMWFITRTAYMTSNCLSPSPKCAPTCSVAAVCGTLLPPLPPLPLKWATSSTLSNCYPLLPAFRPCQSHCFPWKGSQRLKTYRLPPPWVCPGPEQNTVSYPIRWDNCLGRPPVGGKRHASTGYSASCLVLIHSHQGTSPLPSPQPPSLSLTPSLVYNAIRALIPSATQR